MWLSAEKRVPPWSPPQYSQASAGAANSTTASRPTRRRIGKSPQLRRERVAVLFRRFFVGVRRLGHGPGIVFLLGIGNALERFLIGLVVDLGLLLIGFFALVARPPLAHLCICGCSQQRQRRNRYRQDSHAASSP